MSADEDKTVTYEIRVEAESGNRRPWRARIYRDGVYIDKTGFYQSEVRARHAAERLIAEDAERLAKESPNART